jgi:hypothetical protein
MNKDIEKYEKLLQKIYAVKKPMPKLTESLEDGVYVYRDPTNKIRMICGPDTRNAIHKLRK